MDSPSVGGWVKISVIIPNFSDLRIDRAIESVRAQSFPDIELIVIHGGPFSQAFEDIYARHRVDRLIRERDQGIFDALNKGLAAASGDVIYLMGADDRLSDREVFSSVFDRLQICIGCVFVRDDDRVIRRWFPRSISIARMRRGILPPHFSLFLRRSLYDLVGPFKYKETSNVATDTVWLMDAAMAKAELRIPVLLEHHLIMGYGGASTGSWRAVWCQFRTVHQYAGLHRDRLPWWFLFSIVRSSSKLTQFFAA
jgi:glycosyltransferase